MLTQDQILSFLSSYAYEPMMVYSFIILVLTASSFGLPIPEEVTLISAGVIGYFAMNPDLYPPPSPDLKPLNVWTLSVVCLIAVFFSDLLIYWIGRIGGVKLLKSKRFAPIVSSSIYNKAVTLTKKYGALMAGVFRFTPGLRFPGHMACGVLGVSHLKFWLADGVAALLTVPTQVLLVAYYGEEILAYFKQFKIVILITLCAGLLFLYFFKKRLSLS
jgi:membrane protein DedA with SNARE-associated domain